MAVAVQSLDGHDAVAARYADVDPVYAETRDPRLLGFMLFGSGVTMHFALENWKHLNKARFNGWLIATIVLGAGFLLGQAHEYSVVGISWAGSTMGASFFPLTGMHGFHVFIGVCYLIILG